MSSVQKGKAGEEKTSPVYNENEVGHPVRPTHPPVPAAKAVATFSLDAGMEPEVVSEQSFLSLSVGTKNKQWAK